MITDKRITNTLKPSVIVNKKILMGNCHPCRMDATQTVEYWSKKNKKERAKEERQRRRQLSREERKEG